MNAWYCVCPHAGAAKVEPVSRHMFFGPQPQILTLHWIYMIELNGAVIEKTPLSEFLVQDSWTAAPPVL